MKKITRYFSFTLMLALLTPITHAQPFVKNLPVSQQDSSATNFKPYHQQAVSWWDSGNGFVCKVNVDNQNYLTRYDTQGNYIETLKQKAWNENSALWLEIQRSQYKFLKVVSYWEVSDKGKKGYYLEMIDRKNQLSTIWAEESGKLSTVPVNKSKQ